MLQIPPELQTRFESFLNRKGIPKPHVPYYKKWLRYYPDFCHKYHHPDSEHQSLPHFIRKLQEKNQQDFQIRQASQAISFYYEIIIKDIRYMSNAAHPEIIKKNPSETEKQICRAGKYHSEKNNEKVAEIRSEPIRACSWSSAYDGLHAEIKIRHYSPKTLKIYKKWIVKFQTFTKSK